MKMSELTKSLSVQGNSVSFGRHSSDLRGYWCLIQPYEPGADKIKTCFWHQCGHGFTTKEALDNAISVQEGSGNPAPSDSFKL
jgi:hypothetical protein